MQHLLLQATIERNSDDWDTSRFSRLREFLSRLQDTDGRPAFLVTARNRDQCGKPDRLLSNLDESSIDQLWLFASDTGDGLTAADCAGIGRFRRLGRGLMVTCGHMARGCSVSQIDGTGAAYHFHGHSPEHSGDRRRPANLDSPGASRPNGHVGENGDLSRVRAVGHIHPVMRDRHSPTGVIRYLSTHPHEGVVGAPPGDASARVIMARQNLAIGTDRDIAVAFERSARGGRAIAQSSFHPFTDRNGGTASNRPPSDDDSLEAAVLRLQEVDRSTMQYVANIAFWLGS